jgi:predicted amidophosphoribosyltransferase
VAHRARRQASLARDERLRNARGAFVAVAAPARHVVLVDDVYTTGATVAAAASALRRAGTETVEVVTFARTTRL